jgi:hypothetical protein
MPPPIDPLIRRIPPWPAIIRGTLLRYRLPCKRPSCLKCHPGGPKHGPYWYLSVKLNGKTRMRKLQDHHVPAVRRGIRNYHRWWTLSVRVFELNTQALLAKGE